MEVELLLGRLIQEVPTSRWGTQLLDTMPLLVGGG